MTRQQTVWLILAALYGSFVFWYTNTSGALTNEEIEQHLARYAERANAQDLATIEHFMRTDTGNQFIMVNVIDMNQHSEPIGEAQTSAELMAHYMEYMYPALFARGSHPIFAGNAVAPALDLLGISGAENWTMGALMRYRSRRDMFEIASHPSFRDRHEYKLAALTKTIAYPVEVTMSLADPRFHIGMILLLVGLLSDKVLRRS